MEIDSGKRPREEQPEEEGQPLVAVGEQGQEGQEGQGWVAHQSKRRRRERKREAGWGVVPAEHKDVVSRNLAARLFIGNIPYEVNEEQIKSIFEHFGKVEEISMSEIDPKTGRSQGYAFVQYQDPEVAFNVQLVMQGFPFGPRELKVGRPTNLTAEKMMDLLNGTKWEHLLTAQGTTMGGVEEMLNQAKIEANGIIQLLTEANVLKNEFGQTRTNESRIFVGSIPFDISEVDIAKVFAPFGLVISCDLIPNETGGHKGYGFIEFVSKEVADTARETMDGFEFVGRQLRVGPATGTGIGSRNMIANREVNGENAVDESQAGGIGPQLNGAMPSTQQGVKQNNFGVIMMTGGSNRIIGGGMVNRNNRLTDIRSAPEMPQDQQQGHQQQQQQPQQASNMNQPSMVEIGQRNQQVAMMASQATSAAAYHHQQMMSNTLSHEENLTISGSSQRLAIMQKLSRGVMDVKGSRCVLLNNMVGVEDVDDKLQEEVVEECSKFGFVDKVIIYQQEMEQGVIVKVFVLFKEVSAAINAINALNGRFFGFRQIQAVIFNEEKFLRGEFDG